MEAEKSHSDSGKLVASEFARPETRSSDVQGQEEEDLPAPREQSPLPLLFRSVGALGRLDGARPHLLPSVHQFSC